MIQYSHLSNKNIIEHWPWDKKTNETNTTIKNEIENAIKISNKNIQTALNETVHDATTNLVSEVATKMQQSTAASNVFSTGGNVIARGRGSKIKIDQKVSVDTVNQAVMKIATDQTTMANMASSISNTMSDKIQNNNDLKNDLKTVNALSDTKSNAGGPEGIISKIADTVGGILGANPSTSTNTAITNAIKMTVDNSTLNDTSITNIIKDSVTTSIKNITTSSCNIDTSGSNITSIGGDVIAEDGGEVTIEQSAVVTALNKCMSENVASAKLVADMATAGVTTASTDTSNATKADAAMKSDNTITKVDEQKSAIMDFLNNLANLPKLLIIGAVVIAIGGGGLIFLYLMFRKKDPVKDIDDEDDDDDDDDDKDDDDKDDDDDDDDKDDKNKKQKGGNIINPQIQIYALVLSGIFYMLSKYKKNNKN